MDWSGCKAVLFVLVEETHFFVKEKTNAELSSNFCCFSMNTFDAYNLQITFYVYLMILIS